ncbi:hypothetical protein B0H19DRAFT_1111794 [Mycena capillaripes]|nr:hypothetical protein B0H19DRAFT_1111794 [Mycena capillaripes]
MIYIAHPFFLFFLANILHALGGTGHRRRSRLACQPCGCFRPVAHSYSSLFIASTALVLCIICKRAKLRPSSGRSKFTAQKFDNPL